MRFGKVRTLLATLAGAAALVLALPGSANASGWSSGILGFEGADGFTWSFTHAGNGTGGLSTLGSRSGERNGFLSMADGSGFSSVGKTVHLTPVPNHQSDCGLVGWADVTQGAAVLNVEVIDPVDFTYISLKTVYLNAVSPYTQVSTSWHAGPGSQATPLMRFSVSSANGAKVFVRLDDINVVCFY